LPNNGLFRSLRANSSFPSDAFTALKLNRVAFKDVTDGLSKTLAIMEYVHRDVDSATGVPAPWPGNVYPWVLLGSGYNNNLTLGWIRSVEADTPNASVNFGAPTNVKQHYLPFGSLHTRGAQALMGDGSVRFISDEIAFATFESLATRNGGESLSSD
jgi:hypothetical protein